MPIRISLKTFQILHSVLKFILEKPPEESQTKTFEFFKTDFFKVTHLTKEFQTKHLVLKAIKKESSGIYNLVLIFGQIVHYLFCLELPVPTNVTLVRNGTRSLSISWISEACTVDYKIQFVSMRGDELEYEVYYWFNYKPPAFNFVRGEMYQATVQPFTKYGEGNPSLPSLPEQTGCLYCVKPNFF